MHERIIACASASSARAHYSPRERIKCTSALLPARAHPVHERIITRASASSAGAHYNPRERIKCTSALLPARAHQVHERKSLPIHSLAQKRTRSLSFRHYMRASKMIFSPEFNVAIIVGMHRRNINRRICQRM